MNIWSVKIFGIAALAFMLCLSLLIMSGTAFAERCMDNGDGTVTDNGTGLMWQKATAGQMNWDQAMSYASSLSLSGHSGWRLPNKDELQGLYNSPCKDLMDVLNDWYWSSTTYASSTNRAWRVFFVYGYVNYPYKSYSYYVRAVRAAQ
ncbi:MAG: DUF1566 domain-containing protein [Desulfonatronovibrio sp.]|nr:DUF1566 domain-containing protein [Desulfovibrionales bacterium]